MIGFHAMEYELAWPTKWIVEKGSRTGSKGLLPHCCIDVSSVPIIFDFSVGSD